MKRILNIIIITLLILNVSSPSFAATSTPTKATNVKATSKTVNNTVQNKKIDYITLSTPTSIVNNPYSYLNKYVQFPARFNKFSTLGLDYKPAMRESHGYIGVLIERDDVGDSNIVIPLSELKMFMKRSDAEKYTDMNTRDRIFIKGKVFSTALGDPWLDIIELKVLPKEKK